jgi:hypothetical protein
VAPAAAGRRERSAASLSSSLLRTLARPDRRASTPTRTSREHDNRAEYVLDDDDEAFPNWLEAFHKALAGEDAVATCGFESVDEHGRPRSTVLPEPVGSAYENYRALFLSGTFALPRHGCLAIGGFAEGVRYCPNAEFALRFSRIAARRSGRSGRSTSRFFDGSSERPTTAPPPGPRRC